MELFIEFMFNMGITPLSLSDNISYITNNILGGNNNNDNNKKTFCYDGLAQYFILEVPRDPSC